MRRGVIFSKVDDSQEQQERQGYWITASAQCAYGLMCDFHHLAGYGSLVNFMYSKGMSGCFVAL